MANPQLPQRLRSLGKLEQVSAACHHLGFFNNVGLSVHYRLSRSAAEPISNLRRLVYAAMTDVVRKHRILFAIPVNENTPDTYFASLSSIDLNQSVTFLKRSAPVDISAGGQDQELDAILEEQHNTNFKGQYGVLPFWRLVIIEDQGPDLEFTACFIYHHAIGDGVSGLVFHRTFQHALRAAQSSDSLVESNAMIFPDTNARILPPLEELQSLPINPSPQSAPTTNLKEWTGSSIRTPCKAHWASVYISPESSKLFFQQCKNQNLSVTSAVASTVAAVLFSLLDPSVEALTCIIPVSLRPWLNLPREVADSAIGTYFDATKVLFTASKNTTEGVGLENVWSRARHASKAILDYLQCVSPSGEPFTAVAIFKQIPDVSVVFKSMIGAPRDAAFEVTNIGVFSTNKAEKPPNWEVGKVVLSRSPVVSGAAVTVSVATGGDESMTVGFSWQEGVIEENIVRALIGGVADYIIASK